MRLQNANAECECKRLVRDVASTAVRDQGHIISCCPYLTRSIRKQKTRRPFVVTAFIDAPWWGNGAERLRRLTLPLGFTRQLDRKVRRDRDERGARGARARGLSPAASADDDLGSRRGRVRHAAA